MMCRVQRRELIERKPGNDPFAPLVVRRRKLADFRPTLVLEADHTPTRKAALLYTSNTPTRANGRKRPQDTL